MRLKLLFPLAMLVVGVARSAQGPPPKDDFLTANIEPTISPGQDFFLYANGTWFKKNPIPQEEAGWGIWDLVVEDIRARQRRISEAAASRRSARGSIDQLIGDFWAAGMDSAAINRQGLAALQPDFDRIDRVQSIDDLVDVLASFHSRNMGPALFLDYVVPDDENSDKALYTLGLGGLSVRIEYLIQADSQSARVRTALRRCLFKTLSELDRDSVHARARADSVYALELRIANGWYRGDGLQKIPVADLRRFAPSIDWPRYLRGIGITTLDSLNMSKPKFFPVLDAELRATSLDVWRDYLRFWLINFSASGIPGSGRISAR